ncbi:hypothetical protein F0562_014973 [Nyssa sinensis]|uniref:Peptidase A1 domain-containing protein n=1 Tax=Nyssa sinensis TaxID=561372 RepID=A0A5J4ZPZ7_9ASTE|nr:hypothetical protein F0562_014973 [Nyssa sinensis]
MEGKATAILFSFIFLSFSTGFTKPLEYQTLVLRSLPISQKLTWGEESETQETTKWDSETTLSLQLHHLDALSLNATPESLFSLRLQRDAVRVKSLTAAINRNASQVLGNGDFSGTVISGLSQGSGEYFTRLGIGTPQQDAYMVLDTGSDVVWIQCSPCQKCYTQTDPIFDPTKSASFVGLTCGSPLCLRLDERGCNPQQRCLYRVSYGDRIRLPVGELSTETLTFWRTRVDKVAIGCGHDNEGLFAGAAGLLSLGRVRGITASLFKLDPAGHGGVIMDSGTAVTRLSQPAYVAFRDAFLAGASYLKRAPDFSLFDTCFDMSGVTEVKVPTVVLHFVGVDMALPASNYLIPVDRNGSVCFAFAGTMSGVSIIGNIQQQGFRVLYDLAGSRIGFAAGSCP